MTEAEITRDKILRAAGPLFADLGFDVVSVREIAAVAGVHFTAINYHFGTKDKLYQQLLELAARCPEVDAYLEAKGDDLSNPLEQLVELAQLMLSDYEDETARWGTRLLMTEMRSRSPRMEAVEKLWEPGKVGVSRRIGAHFGRDPQDAEIMFRTMQFFILCDMVGSFREILDAEIGHATALEWRARQIVAGVLALPPGAA